jgi:hypothetical protein
MTKKLKKKIQQKIFVSFLDQKLQFTYRYASIRDAQAAKKPSALKREHPALEKMKLINFFYFCGSLLSSRTDLMLLPPC